MTTPSTAAYAGASAGARFGLNEMAMTRTRPMTTPPISAGVYSSSGSRKPVAAAVAMRIASSSPVL
jgi:hypothetical protein